MVEMTLLEIRRAGAAAIEQIDANERDLEILPPGIREHLREMNEMILKLSESYGLSIEFAAEANHPHEAYQNSILMVKERNQTDGSRRLVFSANISITDLG